MMSFFSKNTMRSMTRRNRWRLLFTLSGTILSALFATLAGCKPDEETPQPKPITLHVIGEALPPVESLRELGKEFSRQYGVQIEVHPFEFETALSKTLLDFSAGTGNYDVVYGIYFNLGKYVENKYILPFEPFMNDTTLRDPAVRLDNFFAPVVQVSCEYKGQLYGLPASAQTMFLWYRKDLFSHPSEQEAFAERYGYALPLPTAERAITWAQYRDLAEFFTRKKGATLAGEVLKQDMFGTCLQAKRHPACWYEFGNYIASFGGQVVNEQGDVVVDSPEVLEALEFYLSLRAFSPPGTTQYTWDDALTAVQQGRVALTIMWFDATPSLEDAKASRVAGKMGYGLNPIRQGVEKRAAQYGGWGFYINADSKHPNEAFQFIQWLNRPDIQLKWAKIGGLPATLSTYRDPEYLAIPFHRAERASLEHLSAWTRAPYSEKIISKGARAVSMAASGQTSPADALSQLAKEIREIVSQ